MVLAIDLGVFQNVILGLGLSASGSLCLVELIILGYETGNWNHKC